MTFIVIIPSRYASTRLPGKALAIIHGKPMITHVVKQSQESGAARVIVATDHREIAKAAEAAGAEAILTREDHESGTERLAEVVDLLDINDNEIIINVQGDEPFIEPELIAQVAHDLSTHTANMVTLATPIKNSTDAMDPNVVKVVLDTNGNALYFSRALIPWNRDAGGIGPGDHILQHIGLYGYRAAFLRKYSTLKHVEKLEQLRILYHGEKVHVSVTKSALGLGVDTEEDLERVRGMSPW
ncbi:unnamed protein product [Penicillium glandicola]